MTDEIVKQIHDIIEGEIQNNINEFIEKKGKGFKGEELIANISKEEVNKLVKEYKKINKLRKSNLFQASLLDPKGKPLKVID